MKKLLLALIILPLCAAAQVGLTTLDEVSNIGFCHRMASESKHNVDQWAYRFSTVQTEDTTQMLIDFAFGSGIATGMLNTFDLVYHDVAAKKGYNRFEQAELLYSLYCVNDL